MTERIPVLYLAPWIVYGGSDKNTIDWFRWIDRDRFAPSLITTQPSPNPLIDEVTPFAEEVWVLPDLMPAEDMPRFILDFLQSRDIRVIHLMNSRLGFDLLPDLSCLPNPPSVVVQLHVEEVDRSGYVRYVTTRYGNLVDRFSISNQHVADAVHGYGIPEDKTTVIYTGVDVEEEFSPDRAKAIEDLADDRLQILFAGRLVEQKDPLLAVEVAATLLDRGMKFQLHVVGEGELEGQVRALVAERDLADLVLLHPPTPGLQGWYAACDALLLTSKFEGVPCVLFEAMAMGLPIVAPDLPGIRELLHEEDDGLIEPRDSADAYAELLARLAEDTEHRRALGGEMRERAKRQFSVQQMASMHCELYEELFEAQEKPAAEVSAPLPEPIRFTNRSAIGSSPLVSVLIPHFNQADFLAECVDSVREQTYPNVEVIVVDDSSTQAGAAAALEELEERGDVTVVRLSENGGPSHARNVGLERCSGSYVLPVDSDNLLLPNAVEKLVEQLSVAGEEVGFVYPNIQYFGNREDYYEVPEYNLHTLLYGNFCDTCSLLDREIFDAGLRYADEIRLGHEDWEFVLRLAAHGIRGEAARGPTVRYRKWGFNRSDLVDHARNDFRDDFLAENSPFKGREPQVKAEEAPSLSIVPLAAIEVEANSGCELAASLAAQRCTDIELIGRFDGEWPGTSSVPQARRVPAALAASPFDAVRQGLDLCRGAYVALTSGTGSLPLGDPAFAEKVLRRFATAGDRLDAIAFLDAGDAGGYPFRPLPEGGRADAVPHTVVWRRQVELALPWGLHADPGDPVGSILRQLSGAGAQVEWRHLPSTETVAGAEPDGTWAPLPKDPANVADPDGLRPSAKPLLPGRGRYRVPRWKLTPTWIAPLSTIAIRYRERYGEGRLVTNGQAPAGYVPEHHLGALRSTGVEGTARLVRIGDDYRTVPRGDWHSTPDGAEEIGYVELARLPEMDALALAVHRATGQRVLVSLPDDPILDSVDVIENLGCLDAFPLRPRSVPSTQLPLGLVGLVKAVDYGSRRHRYGIGAMPDGELIEEVGALAESELQGSIPAWIVDGYLITARHRQPSWQSGAIAAIRWAAEPAVWRGLAPPVARVKTMARRSAIGALRRARVEPLAGEGTGDPAGWLFESERPGLVPLFASYHPVTGDQLLTRSLEDAAQMGYVNPQLLGFLRRLAPLTGDLDRRHLSVPWARRFGAVPQTG